jgi:pimeloyl-ACP methyl ester carboxylesterase
MRVETRELWRGLEGSYPTTRVAPRLMERPTTQYVTVGDAQIAYQVIGDGPIDLVSSQGFGSNIEIYWDYPPARRFFERLASFTRLILFDRRGTGSSDAVRNPGAWEEHTDDLHAVLDAVGAEQPALCAWFDAGAVSMLFAAAHPQRTRGLILWNSFARVVGDDDYPIGYSAEEHKTIVDLARQGWGSEEFTKFIEPSRADDPAAIEWIARMIRTSSTPAAAADAMATMGSLDARSALSSIHVPTLVLHRSALPMVTAPVGRFVADRIPDARYVEVEGGDWSPWDDGSELILDSIEEFLTGTRSGHRTDRVLTTLMFLDIAAATEQLAQLGDRRWQEMLQAHDRIARSAVDSYGGNIITTTNDGFLATFDLPGRAINCAIQVRDRMRSIGIDTRAGLHTGEVHLVRGGDIEGIAVHIAARVMNEGGRGDILCSRTVKDLVAGSGFCFNDLGPRSLKGVPEERQLFEVLDGA